MNHHSLKSRLAGLLLLTSVSMAGFMGPSLHALVHLDPSGGDSSAESTACCSCGCHAGANQAKNADDRQADLPIAAEEHDCAICRYLALSKQVNRIWDPEVVAQVAVDEVCSTYLFDPCSTFTLRTAARGPPSLA